MTGDPLRRLELLLDPARLAHPPSRRSGYLDLGTAPDVHSAGQALMRFPPYAAIYQGFRPHAYRLATGLRAPGRDGDVSRAIHALSLRAGMVVLDVGCGPGNFTGPFAHVVGEDGLAVGLDASTEMLLRAVADNSGPDAAYVRADAATLPFADGTVDAVSCFAALYLMDHPHAVLAECSRVLRPGGRLAVMTSCASGPLPVRLAVGAAGWASGVRIFGREEITGWLTDLGMRDVDQRVEGVSQLITATR